MRAGAENCYFWIDEARINFDYDAFRSRLRNAIHAEEYRWDDLCRRAGLSPAGAKSAIDSCEQDFAPHLDILEQLAAPLGRTARWLITGRSPDNEIVVAVREQTHTLIDDFAYKQEIPRADVARLHSYANAKFKNLFTQTPQAVYRCGIPQTLRDVGYIYDEMLASQG